MTFQALNNDSYIVDQAGDTAYIGSPIMLKNPNKSLCFQFRWGENVNGVFKFEASVFNDTPQWIPLVSCQAVEFKTSDYSENLTNIVAIPEVWNLVSMIRITYQPNTGSSGNWDCAIRVVPI